MLEPLHIVPAVQFPGIHILSLSIIFPSQVFLVLVLQVFTVIYIGRKPCQDDIQQRDIQCLRFDAERSIRQENLTDPTHRSFRDCVITESSSECRKDAVDWCLANFLTLPRRLPADVLKYEEILKVN